MLNLDTTTALVKAVTSSTADLDAIASYVDYKAADETFVSEGQNTAITTATTTTIVSSPTSGYVRNVKGINLRNKHASTANTVTVKQTDGTTEVEVFKATLAAGESMSMNDQGVWFVYDVNGGVKTGSPAASDTTAGAIAIATQADQETGSSVVLAVTPGRQHFHPSACKFWANVTGAGSPALSASYNVTSVADTNTGRMTVTIATDFSSAAWSLGGTGIGSTTVTSAAMQWGVSKAAGSIEIDNSDLSATPVVEDPTVGYDIQGFGDQA